ncbi:MAG TPA: zinc-dependent alcohol dehydrogenase family protein [Alphaproteobacteria bacterium]|nr:zinc-dependent alcohol dehydrogenase family protein [Alphaproteobacteria bacterium]
MRAMVLDSADHSLHPDPAREIPQPTEGQVRVRVRACGVCRTDLHVVDGELSEPKPSLIPGHEVVGIVDCLGPGVSGLKIGDRVGIPWLGWTCGKCRFCLSGRENLCERAKFTGYTLDGGYAEYAAADARYCFKIPNSFDDEHAAPLLCAGLIGYRALRFAGRSRRVGLYGFGAAAHIAAQIAQSRGQEIYAFTRPGDHAAQQFALTLGAKWAGGSDIQPPTLLDAALIFAPVGELVPAALGALDAGGIVVCAGIHMSDIPRLPYSLLWREREIRSVANLTRQDGEQFFAAAVKANVKTTTTPFALADANVALEKLRSGNIEGAAVLIP